MDSPEILIKELDNAPSDKELFDAASRIVAIPKKSGEGPWDASFILHAPLEICARYFLLPLVDDERANGARRQVRQTAKKYFEFEDERQAQKSNPDLKLNFANMNVERWATTLLFASHPIILLAMQNALGETNESIDSVLQNMSDGIDSNLDSQMEWTKHKSAIRDLSPELLANPQHWFVDYVGNVDHVNFEDESIRGGIEAVEASGLIAPLVETIGAIASFSERADFQLPFKSLLRVAALSMLIENDEHSKYGWSHCLTIPHAIWSLANNANDKSTMLKAATTHVATFRSLMSEEKMLSSHFVEYFEEEEHSVFAEHYVRMEDIISQSCILEDAHLVKYVYSCFDLMKRDPQYSKLYIAAAGKLLSIWQS